MRRATRLRCNRSGWCALTISILVHAAIALALWRLPARSQPALTTEPVELGIALLEREPSESIFVAARSDGKVITLRPEDTMHITPVVLQAIDPSERTQGSFLASAGAAQRGAGGHTNSSGKAGQGSTFFPVGRGTKSVVYVLDRSSSMGFHGALDGARDELTRSLATLPPTAQFQIIVYNHTAGVLVPSCPGLIAATDENRRLIATALQDLLPVGGTKHEHALPLALALQPGVIFFLTDADDLTDAYIHAITAKNRGRSIIHTIELSSANRHRTDTPLQMLARQNRGTYRAVDLAADR